MSKVAEETENLGRNTRRTHFRFAWRGSDDRPELALPSVGIFLAAFLLIVWAKLDVALVAIAAIVGGVLYSLTGLG